MSKVQETIGTDEAGARSGLGDGASRGDAAGGGTPNGDGRAATSLDSGAAGGGIERANRASAASKPEKRTLIEKMEAWVSRLSVKNNFWHRICSLAFLPYAFRSGIRMKRTGERAFAAELPFNRFNKNFYNAMAGAALLGNAEIAGGMYVFGFAGGDYTVVCKKLEYRFLRPCFGPAEYRIEPKEDLEELIAKGTEFNVTVEMGVFQIIPSVIGDRVSKAQRKARKKRRKAELRAARGEKIPTNETKEQHASREARLERLKKREKRVGKAIATFHVTPKAHYKRLKAQQLAKDNA